MSCLSAYTDHYSDTETALLYMNARYYDPELKRFTSVDPPLVRMLSQTNRGIGPNMERLMNPQKLNLYTYVDNNPIRYSDPTGEDAVDWFDIALGILTLGLLGGAQQAGDDSDPNYSSVEGAALDIVSQDVYDNSGYIQGGVFVGTTVLTKGKNLSNNVDDAIRGVRDYARGNGGAAQPGYRGGGTFQNDGRNGGEVLPTQNSRGDSVTYREYDINPHQSGVNRGQERVVIGSDGRTYYTDDHYDNFIDITDYE